MDITPADDANSGVPSTEALLPGHGTVSSAADPSSGPGGPSAPTQPSSALPKPRDRKYQLFAVPTDDLASSSLKIESHRFGIVFSISKSAPISLQILPHRFRMSTELCADQNPPRVDCMKTFPDIKVNQPSLVTHNRIPVHEKHWHSKAARLRTYESHVSWAANRKRPENPKRKDAPDPDPWDEPALRKVPDQDSKTRRVRFRRQFRKYWIRKKYPWGDVKGKGKAVDRGNPPTAPTAPTQQDNSQAGGQGGPPRPGGPPQVPQTSTTPRAPVQEPAPRESEADPFMADAPAPDPRSVKNVSGATATEDTEHALLFAIESAVILGSNALPPTDMSHGQPKVVLVAGDEPTVETNDNAEIEVEDATPAVQESETFFEPISSPTGQILIEHHLPALRAVVTGRISEPASINEILKTNRESSSGPGHAKSHKSAVQSVSTLVNLRGGASTSEEMDLQTSQGEGDDGDDEEDDDSEELNLQTSQGEGEDGDDESEDDNDGASASQNRRGHESGTNTRENASNANCQHRNRVSDPNAYNQVNGIIYGDGPFLVTGDMPSPDWRNNRTHHRTIGRQRGAPGRTYSEFERQVRPNTWGTVNMADPMYPDSSSSHKSSSSELDEPRVYSGPLSGDTGSRTSFEVAGSNLEGRSRRSSYEFGDSELEEHHVYPLHLPPIEVPVEHISAPGNNERNGRDFYLFHAGYTHPLPREWGPSVSPPRRAAFAHIPPQPTQWLANTPQRDTWPENLQQMNGVPTNMPQTNGIPQNMPQMSGWPTNMQYTNEWPVNPEQTNMGHANVAPPDTGSTSLPQANTMYPPPPQTRNEVVSRRDRVNRRVAQTWRNARQRGSSMRRYNVTGR